jgi:hypothetical protein
MDSSDASNVYITDLVEATTYTFFGWAVNTAGKSENSADASAVTLPMPIDYGTQPTSQPKLYFDFNDSYVDSANGAVAIPASGNSISNTVFKSASGSVFFGTIPSNLKLPEINFTTNGISLGFWCYNTRAAGESNATALFMGYQTGANSFHLFLNVGAEYKLRFQIGTNQQSTNVSLESYRNQWVHIALTVAYNATTPAQSVYTIYVNGSVADSPYIYPYPVIVSRTSNYFSATNENQSFRGYIDDFFLYDEVLSASEIRYIWETETVPIL